MMFSGNSRSKNWNHAMNGNIKPEHVRAYSQKKYWFSCERCSHNFEMALSNVSNGSWCPYCTKKTCGDKNCSYCFKRSIIGLYPELFSKENDVYFDPNNTLKGYNLLPNSSKKIWWICSEKGECGCEHRFETKVADFIKGRKNGNKGCPYCTSW